MQCVSVPKDKELEKKNKQIEKELKRSKRELLSEIKLLLLGTGESGKSTFAKQLKIIHAGGFTEAELQTFIGAAHSNSIQCMEALIKYVNKRNWETKEENKPRIERFNSRGVTTRMTQQLVEDMKALWADPSIKKAFKKRNEFQIFDSAEYCFANLDRFITPNYLPTQEDVIRFRVRSTGIIETKFKLSSSAFNIVDVGGQRSERRKWIHCFEAVTALIYVAALNEFDMRLYEDEQVNRLDEALELFEEIVNSKWFSRTPILLFLNKADLFKEKIQKDLSKHFQEYKGGNDFDKGCQFILQLFLSRNKNQDKLIFSHITTATDTQNVNKVFTACRTIILGSNLSTI